MIDPAACDRAAEYLTSASHVERIEFYVTKSDNKAAELHCRIFGLHPLTKDELERLSSLLNEAIAPFKNELSQTLVKYARDVITESK